MSMGAFCPRVEHEAGTLVVGRKIFVKWQKYSHLLRLCKNEPSQVSGKGRAQPTAVSLANLHQCCKFTSESSINLRNK